MNYVEALSELQQRGFDALKVAQSTQVASLEVTRQFAEALTAPRSPVFAVPKLLGTMTEITTSFTFALLEQQVAYAKELTDTLADRSKKATPEAHATAAPAAPSVDAPTGVESPAVVSLEAPIEAALLEPAPIEAALLEPAPIEAALLEPAPIEAALLEPAPIEAALLEPAPIEADSMVASEPAPILEAAVSEVLHTEGVIEPSIDRKGEAASISDQIKRAAAPSEDVVAKTLPPPAAIVGPRVAKPGNKKGRKK